jgi:hypothetical protein
MTLVNRPLAIFKGKDPFERTLLSIDVPKVAAIDATGAPHVLIISLKFLFI